MKLLKNQYWKLNRSSKKSNLLKKLIPEEQIVPEAEINVVEEVVAPIPEPVTVEEPAVVENLKELDKIYNQGVKSIKSGDLEICPGTIQSADQAKKHILIRSSNNYPRQPRHIQPILDYG